MGTFSVTILDTFLFAETKNGNGRHNNSAISTRKNSKGLTYLEFPQ